MISELESGVRAGLLTDANNGLAQIPRDPARGPLYCKMYIASKPGIILSMEKPQLNQTSSWYLSQMP